MDPATREVVTNIAILVAVAVIMALSAYFRNH